jgi:hypothetical protein
VGGRTKATDVHNVSWVEPAEIYGQQRSLHSSVDPKLTQTPWQSHADPTS